MTPTLPNPFEFETVHSSRTDQLTARAGRVAVLSFPEPLMGGAGANASAPTSLSGLDHLTAAYVFGGLRAELATAVRELRGDMPAQQLTRYPAHQHRERVEDQDRLDHLVGHLRSPSTSPNTISGINAHEQ